MGFCVLHITNDYSGSRVYKNLIRELDNLGIQQIIYNPVREEKRVGRNIIDLKVCGSQIIYRPILNYHIDRYVYPFKIQKIVRDIQKQVDINSINFIHAHTWYSDGGVAYIISKKWNIPFIVTIRNTDLNVFHQKLRYIRPFGRKILSNSQSVILISASYKKRLLNQISLKTIKKELSKKLIIIPNGVDPYWIKNSSFKRKHKTNIVYKLLYIGKFDKGKNVPSLQEAVKLINRRNNIKVHLNLIGGDGDDQKTILQNCQNHPDLFTFHGKIFDKYRLYNIFQKCDIFTMPSKHETFGLVYVEAMLNGLPILYTKGEGIDGFYENTIGEKVGKLADEKEIKQALLKLIKNYSYYRIPFDKLIENHNWKIIANKYVNLYKLKRSSSK